MRPSPKGMRLFNSFAFTSFRGRLRFRSARYHVKTIVMLSGQEWLSNGAPRGVPAQGGPPQPWAYEEPRLGLCFTRILASFDTIFPGGGGGCYRDRGSSDRTDLSRREDGVSPVCAWLSERETRALLD